MDDWALEKVEIDDNYYNSYIGFMFFNLERVTAFSNLLLSILNRVEHYARFKRHIAGGPCFIWSCVTAYILDGMPYIKAIKVMRTKDNQHSWLAIKFMDNDAWYAFDRTIYQFRKYKEYKFGIYLSLDNAEEIAPYFSDKNSIEITFPDKLQMLGISGAVTPLEGETLKDIEVIKEEGRKA